MLETLTATLFSQASTQIIYHYTNLSGLLGISETKTLWASDIRCMNDAAELHYFAALIKQVSRNRLRQNRDEERLLKSFIEWIEGRITVGRLLFASSFHEDGNLLSQWRGYSSVGQGVSIGFSAKALQQQAQAQHFLLGQCIYDESLQLRLIKEILDFIVSSSTHAPSLNNDDEQLNAFFTALERDLFRIAALFKHPSFQEEKEWRIVSDLEDDVNQPCTTPIAFRQGHTMLVPYLTLSLNELAFHHLFLGPTPNAQTSLNTLQMFLKEKQMQPSHGVEYCNIPYRLQ